MTGGAGQWKLGEAIQCRWCNDDLVRDSPRRIYHDHCKDAALGMNQRHWQERKRERERLGLPSNEWTWTWADESKMIPVYLDQELDWALRGLL